MAGNQAMKPGDFVAVVCVRNEYGNTPQLCRYFVWWDYTRALVLVAELTRRNPHRGYAIWDGADIPPVSSNGGI